MGESLTASILEAHRAGGRGRAARGGRPERAAFKADHVVLEGHDAELALRLFETLGLERHGVELALACGEDEPLGRLALAEEHARLERLTRGHGVVLSRAGNGASHQVYVARFAGPGRLVLGTSSRVTACGALGSLGFAVSATEAAAALAGAPIDLPWPEAVPVRLFGKPPEWLSGEDLALELERRLSFAPPHGRVLEFHTIEAQVLEVPDRVTLATRAVSLGAASALFHSDEVTRSFLKAQAREPDWKGLGVGEGYETSGMSLDVDFSDLEPLFVGPGSGPVLRLRELGEAPVSSVWIGPEATMMDLERLARRLAEAPVAEGMECRVTLGNRQLHETAARAGLIEILGKAGARIGSAGDTPARLRPGAGVGLACGAPGARADGWHETGIAACAAALSRAAVTDPRHRSAAPQAAESYVVDDRLIVRPPSEPPPAAEAGAPPPRAPGIRGPLRGVVLIKVGDHCDVDRVLPWGARVRPLASDIDRLAAHAFAGVDSGFAERARREGQGWVVAGHDFGIGARRDEVALVAVALGVRGVLARSFAPEFKRLLRQHGLLGLRFGSDPDMDAIAAGDELEIPDLPEGLEEGKPLVVRNLSRGTQHAVHHDLDEAGVREVRAGGLLALLKEEGRAAA